MIRATGIPEPTATSTNGPLPPILFALALALLFGILVKSMPAAGIDPGSDDGYYLRYMQSVRTEGLSSFPKLFEQWNTTERDWIYPPPSRVGFVVASALWAGLFGASFQALQTLSLASHLVLCVVNYLFARRHFGEPKALFIGVLLGFSPLLMGISRLALTDSFNALCMTTTIWLFFDLVERPEKLLRRVLFMASLAFMVLVKELSVLLVLPFVAFVLYERFVRKVPHDLGRFALDLAIPGLVAGPIFVLAAGSATRLFETTRIVLASPKTNVYAIQYGSGPWFRAILDYLLFSPWPTLLAIGWFFALALRRDETPYDRRCMFLAFVAAFLIFELSFFTKNIRYTVALELPIRVFAVLMLSELFRGLRPARATALTGAMVLALCWLDWRMFELVWVRFRCYDPVTFFLAGVHHLIPTAAR